MYIYDQSVVETPGHANVSLMSSRSEPSPVRSYICCRTKALQALASLQRSFRIDIESALIYSAQAVAAATFPEVTDSLVWTSLRLLPRSGCPCSDERGEL